MVIGTEVVECHPIPEKEIVETKELMCESNDHAKQIQDMQQQMEERLLQFERMLDELKTEVNEVFTEHNGSISHIHTEMSRMSGQDEFKQLRRDFDVFSKRLRRVVKAEDSLSAETLDAAKVPPDVLEITYAKTLNDLYAAMLNIFGDRESSEIVEDIRDKVRQFSAGVDFFRFENGTFHVKGLSDAISSKLVSIKQIHATYVELFKMLTQAVPNYNSQDFRSFVETGSREYTIQKVVSHDRSIERMASKISGLSEELVNLTENMQFMSELQNTLLEDVRSHTSSIDDMKGQIKDITKAVNLHTKAIRKLGRTLEEQHASGLAPSNAPPAQNPQTDMCAFEEGLALKVSRDEMLSVLGEISSFREEVNSALAQMQEQILLSINGTDAIQVLRDEMMQMRGEIAQMMAAHGKDNADMCLAEIGTVDKVLDDSVTGPYMTECDLSDVGLSGPGITDICEPVDISGASDPDINGSENDIPDIQGPMTSLPEHDGFDGITSEDGNASIGQLVLEEVGNSGPVTMKQLEIYISSKYGLVCSDELVRAVDQMIQVGSLSSFKKGRYTYFALRDIANV